MDFVRDVSAVYCDRKNVSNKTLCMNVCQKCDVTAEYAVAVHSVYDISVRDVVDAMNLAGVEKMYGTFIFHPMMLIEKEGVIPGLDVSYRYIEPIKRKVYKGEACMKNVESFRKIEFSFKDDSSFMYVHRVRNLFAYMFVSIIYDSGFNNLYYLERHSVFSLLYFFCLETLLFGMFY